MYLKPFAHAITAPANQHKSDKSVSKIISERKDAETQRLYK